MKTRRYILQIVEVSKRGFEKVHFLFLSFLCWIKQKRKDEKMEKIENSVFGWF